MELQDQQIDVLHLIVTLSPHGALIAWGFLNCYIDWNKQADGHQWRRTHKSDFALQGGLVDKVRSSNQRPR